MSVQAHVCHTVCFDVSRLPTPLPPFARFRRWRRRAPRFPVVCACGGARLASDLSVRAEAVAEAATEAAEPADDLAVDASPAALGQLLRTAARSSVPSGRFWPALRFGGLEGATGAATSAEVALRHATLAAALAGEREGRALPARLRAAAAVVEPAHVLAALSRRAFLAERGGQAAGAGADALDLLGQWAALGLEDQAPRDLSRALWLAARCVGGRAPPGPGRAAVAAVVARLVAVPASRLADGDWVHAAWAAAMLVPPDGAGATDAGIVVDRARPLLTPGSARAAALVNAPRGSAAAEGAATEGVVAAAYWDEALCRLREAIAARDSVEAPRTPPPSPSLSEAVAMLVLAGHLVGGGRRGKEAGGVRLSAATGAAAIVVRRAQATISDAIPVIAALSIDDRAAMRAAMEAADTAAADNLARETQSSPSSLARVAAHVEAAATSGTGPIELAAASRSLSAALVSSSAEVEVAAALVAVVGAAHALAKAPAAKANITVASAVANAVGGVAILEAANRGDESNRDALATTVARSVDAAAFALACALSSDDSVVSDAAGLVGAVPAIEAAAALVAVPRRGNSEQDSPLARLAEAATMAAARSALSRGHLAPGVPIDVVTRSDAALARLAGVALPHAVARARKLVRLAAAEAVLLPSGLWNVPPGLAAPVDGEDDDGRLDPWLVDNPGALCPPVLWLLAPTSAAPGAASLRTLRTEGREALAAAMTPGARAKVLVGILRRATLLVRDAAWAGKDDHAPRWLPTWVNLLLADEAGSSFDVSRAAAGFFAATASIDRLDPTPLVAAANRGIAALATSPSAVALGNLAELVSLAGVSLTPSEAATLGSAESVRCLAPSFVSCRSLALTVYHLARAGLVGSSAVDAAVEAGGLDQAAEHDPTAAFALWHGACWAAARDALRTGGPWMGPTPSARAAVAALAGLPADGLPMAPHFSQWMRLETAEVGQPRATADAVATIERGAVVDDPEHGDSSGHHSLGWGADGGAPAVRTSAALRALQIFAPRADGDGRLTPTERWHAMVSWRVLCAAAQDGGGGAEPTTVVGLAKVVHRCAATAVAMGESEHVAALFVKPLAMLARRFDEISPPKGVLRREGLAALKEARRCLGLEP